MSNDSIKWLLAGLAGAVLTLCLLGTGAYMAFRLIQEGIDEMGSTNPIYGPDQWHEKEADFLAEKAEKDAELAASGLLDRYTIVDIHGDTRQLLFEQQDFATVEDRLAEQFEQADTPMKKYRYGQHVQRLGDFFYGEDPEAYWSTLNAWVGAYPDSYRARLVRGSFAINYAWYYRGNALAKNVTSAGWTGFREYLDIARTDLEAAHAMNPADPESTALLITVAGGQSRGIQEIDRYYEQTLAVNPLHYRARSAKLNFVQPKWGGSWEAVEAIIADCKALQSGFPLFVNIIRDGENNMRERGEEFEGTWGSEETYRMMYEGYRAQAALSPDDLRVQADFAYYASIQFRFGEAYRAMESVGNLFPEHCRYEPLPQYHYWRTVITAEYSQDPVVVNTPRELELLEEALALQPENTTAATMYLGYLARMRDDALTRAFHDNLQDAYLMTGDWANPPNYTLMEGMAKAGRSDDYGVRDTDAEKPLLDAGFALAPENALVRLVYAEYYITRRDFDAAETHLTRAREIDPDYLPALHIMGWLHFHQKRWDQAIETANEFLARGPSRYVEDNTSDAQEIIELCEEKKREES